MVGDSWPSDSVVVLIDIILLLSGGFVSQKLLIRINLRVPISFKEYDLRPIISINRLLWPFFRAVNFENLLLRCSPHDERINECLLRLHGIWHWSVGMLGATWGSAAWEWIRGEYNLCLWLLRQWNPRVILENLLSSTMIEHTCMTCFVIVGPFNVLNSLCDDPMLSMMLHDITITWHRRGCNLSLVYISLDQLEWLVNDLGRGAILGPRIMRIFCTTRNRRKGIGGVDDFWRPASSLFLRRFEDINWCHVLHLLSLLMLVKLLLLRENLLVRCWLELRASIIVRTLLSEIWLRHNFALMTMIANVTSRLFHSVMMVMCLLVYRGRSDKKAIFFLIKMICLTHILLLLSCWSLHCVEISMSVLYRGSSHISSTIFSNWIHILIFVAMMVVIFSLDWFISLRKISITI